jgi:predicted RND superfamily exporter protein
MSLLFCSLSDFFVDGIHVSLFQNGVVSLIPNLLPLMITAGLMGYFGIPLKPSTILVLVLLLTFSR